MTAKKKETYFVNSVKALIQEHSKAIENIANYIFLNTIGMVNLVHTEPLWTESP